MINIADTIWFLLKVTILFLLLYVFVPYKFIKIDKASEFDILDKIFIFLIHSNLVTIVLVHVLVICKIYETISLIVGYILVTATYYWILNKRKTGEGRTMSTSLVAKALDSIEENSGIANTIKRIFITAGKNISALAIRVYDRFRSNPIGMILVMAVFAFGAFVRFSHSFLHVYYGASDPYVHLAWTKYLGENLIYVDGVYPYGYNAIISALSKISFTDPYVVIRFIGALGGCLIIFSIFYIIRKMTGKSIIPALFGIVAYTVGTGLPVNTWRQMSALPQEYATVFILPGIYFLLKYFEKKERKYLFLSAEVLALTLLIHTYAAIIMTGGYLIVCLFNLRSFINLKFTAKFAGVMIISALFGFLPIIIGSLSGIRMHQASIDFIIQGGGSSDITFQISDLMSYAEKNTSLSIMIIISVVFAIISLTALFFKKGKNKMKVQAGLIFIFVSVILYLQYRAQDLGLPALMEMSRTGTFLGLTAAVMIGMFIGSIDMFPINKWISGAVKIIACTVVFAFLFNVSNLSLPVGEIQEYDEAANSYMQIKKDYPAAAWTIVSPVEQYSECLGYGWHYQLWQFMKDVDAEKKDKVIIPTQYVFWFVEKIPVKSAQKITEADSKLDFPIITGNYDEYYTIAENRKIIEAKAYYWLEDYISKNKDLDMSIYLDTENMRIYKLTQNESSPVDFAE
ncbi:MAG: hypothetical protein ACYCYI_10785 [Saccharofermentanales bacterium]